MTLYKKSVHSFHLQKAKVWWVYILFSIAFFTMLAKFTYLNSLLILMQRRIVAFQAVTENNHVLVGHVFQQLYNRDWFNCIQACHNDSRCISYNYERSAGVNGLCELNDCGVEDLCDRQKSLIYSVGFVFQQIRKCTVSCFWCDASKCSFYDERALSMNFHIYSASYSIIRGLSHPLDNFQVRKRRDYYIYFSILSCTNFFSSTN